MCRTPFQRLIAAWLLSLGASTGHAWEVLGCTFMGDVPGFISCVNNASSSAAQQAANQAATSYQSTINTLQTQLSTLQNSPYLANLPGEQQALLALRQMPIEELRTCLADAGLQLGNVMGGAMTNPTAFAQARLGELFSDAAALAPQLLDPSLAGLRQGQAPPPNPQTVGLFVDRAYNALTRLAEEDPVARCTLPLLTAMQPQIRQAALAAYAQAEAAGNQVMESVVRPALDQALTVSLQQMLSGMGGGGPAVPPPPGRAPGRTLPPQQQPAAGPRAPAATTPPLDQRTPLRTRSIAGAMPGAGALPVPDDVQRIALAVFTERMLDPRALQQLTAEVNALSAAMANGTATSFDATNLNRLIERLSVPRSEMATELGIEVARFYGHWTIDKVGGLLLDAGLGSAAATEAVVMEVAGAICSIGDVFSGVPCAVIKGIVSFVYLQVALPALNQALMAGYHVGYDQAVNCAAQAIRAGQNPAQQAQAGCGTLGGLLVGFPSGAALAAFALPQIDQTQTALFAYQQAVGNLTTIARSGQQRR